VLGSDDSLSGLFHDRRGASPAIEPLKHLKMAVLADALRCYRRNVDAVKLRKRRECEEAQNPLFEDRNGDALSFDTVCCVRDANPAF
jgi:hypothetical protein